MTRFCRFNYIRTACLLLLLTSTALQAARILVIGDSWAIPTARALQGVVDENGHTNTIVQITPYWGYASELASDAGLATISSWLEKWPDTRIIHLSTGANDMGRTWEPSMAGTLQEDQLLTQIMNDVETVVDHINSIRPDIRILWSSYDYFRRINRQSPAETNGIYHAMAARSENFVLSREPRMTYMNLYGLFQVTYGFDGVVRESFDPSHPIPPGDPSLPDSNLPSPWEPYGGDRSHPTPRGFKVFAQAMYDRHYASELESVAFQINAGLNDVWYNPATDGQGFFITVFPDLGLVSLSWFTYDTEPPAVNASANLGDPGQRWLNALGQINGNRSLMTVSFASGGLFDTPTAINRVDDGTITLSFNNCKSGSVKYDIPSIGRSGTVPIERIAPDNVALCEALITQ
jgi:hypothetical protein